MFIKRVVSTPLLTGKVRASFKTDLTTRHFGLQNFSDTNAIRIQTRETGISSPQKTSFTARPSIIEANLFRPQGFHTQNINMSRPRVSIKIRPIASKDEPTWRTHWQAYNDFYKRTIPEEATSTTFTRFLDSNTKLFCAVAESEDPEPKVIGFVTWFPHLTTSNLKPIVYLQDLFVDPNVRGGGVGGKLIDYVYEHAKTELGAASVYWHTQEFNHRAQILYVEKAAKTPFVHYLHAL